MADDYNRHWHLLQLGTDKTCNETLRYFVTEVPEYLATVLTNVNYKNPSKAACIAKTIKEAAKIIGAESIIETAAQLEHTIQDNPSLEGHIVDIVTDLCSVLLEKNTALKKISEQYLKPLPSTGTT